MSKAKRSTQNSATRRTRGKPRGRPLQSGHPWRFPPGQSGNPGGRPKAVGMAYASWLAFTAEDGRTNAEHVAEEVGRLALSGDLHAVVEMREATEGKAVQPFAGLAPDMSDAKDRLAAIVGAVAARSDTH